MRKIFGCELHRPSVDVVTSKCATAGAPDSDANSRYRSGPRRLSRAPSHGLL